MTHLWHFFLFLFTISLAAESQFQDPDEQVIIEEVTKVPPYWTNAKRARNPYSWMAAEQGMGGRSPYSWMSQKKRSFRYASSNYRSPRNPYSWVYTMFDKRARNPYSWMND
ncbi:hypothetical protein KIN20_027877 [Parelaphostrongylus tenuis]|uniref:Uncharacterized protein n=1 Tax=Parelaphostrongylus tenuis TaxID=148309 RepID=A0AAD5WE80_PARTN|nr:hypothetical protein KIN20_027877 [Parelaphostrongylus tenuis]